MYQASLSVVIGYRIVISLLTRAIKTIPVGITYAVWTGLGIVLVAIVGAIISRQISDTPTVIGMGLIVAGVVVINLFLKNDLLLNAHMRFSIRTAYTYIYTLREKELLLQTRVVLPYAATTFTV